MSPANIRTLLHIYYVGEPLPDTTIAREGVLSFMSLGLISKAETPSGYETTERGNAFVRMLIATPLPVVTYVDPQTNEVCK